MDGWSGVLTGMLASTMARDSPVTMPVTWGFSFRMRDGRQTGEAWDQGAGVGEEEGEIDIVSSQE